ncbi:MAG: dTDP-4-dehydrorhamnose 3,5-epimerase [bacterium]
MKFTPTEIPGVVVVEPEVFEDARGLFMETFHRKKYASGGIDRAFVQDNYSLSVQGTLRGLHYQFPRPQAKLVYVLSGEIYDVAVDIRRDSPTFRQWVGITLSAENRRQFFVPEGFAHGFCVVSETARVLYKCTDFYHPEYDRGILWSDPSLAIRWPIREPLLSAKDAGLPMLENGMTLNP